MFNLENKHFHVVHVKHTVLIALKRCSGPCKRMRFYTFITAVVLCERKKERKVSICWRNKAQHHRESEKLSGGDLLSRPLRPYNYIFACPLSLRLVGLNISIKPTWWSEWSHLSTRRCEDCRRIAALTQPACAAAPSGWAAMMLSGPQTELTTADHLCTTWLIW